MVVMSFLHLNRLTFHVHHIDKSDSGAATHCAYRSSDALAPILAAQRDHIAPLHPHAR